jgi:quinol monooxygenase YgiN
MLTIIARPTVDPDRLEDIKLAMLDLVEDTLKEEGCIRYELHQDNSQSNRLTFFETYYDLWQQHMEGDAVRKFRERSSGGIVAMDMTELTQISP